MLLANGTVSFDGTTYTDTVTGEDITPGVNEYLEVFNDKEEMLAAFEDELDEQLRAQCRTLEARQNAAAAAAPERRPARGLGEYVAGIDPKVFFLWDAHQQITNNAKPGECWNDRGFLRDLQRDNENLRVRYARPGDRASMHGASADGDVWVPSSAPRNIRETTTYGKKEDGGEEGRGETETRN